MTCRSNQPGSPIDLSEALVTYLGSGSTIYRDRDPRCLTDAYGPLQAADLVLSCNRVLDELYSLSHRCGVPGRGPGAPGNPSRARTSPCEAPVAGRYPSASVLRHLVTAPIQHPSKSRRRQ